MARTRWMKALALLLALASLTINFGLIDLIDGYTGFVDQARNQVLDAGWGLVFGVILPIGLLAQLRRPERRIAGIQQTGIVALALAAAAVLGEAWSYLALAAGIAGACAVLLALHPARRTFLARGAPGACAAGTRGGRCSTGARVRLANGLGAAAGSSARRRRVERPAPLDRDDGARTARPHARTPRRPPHSRLAHSGAQRLDRGRRLGDLVPART